MPSPWTGGSASSPAASPAVDGGNAPQTVAADKSPSLPSDTLDAPEPEPGGPLSNDPAATPGKSGIMPNGVSVPSDFPHINITTQNNPDAGLIFINNHSSGQRYNVIFDNNGSPVWYVRTPDRRLDMKVQPQRSDQDQRGYGRGDLAAWRHAQRLHVRQ